MPGAEEPESRLRQLNPETVEGYRMELSHYGTPELLALRYGKDFIEPELAEAVRLVLDARD